MHVQSFYATHDFRWSRSGVKLDWRETLRAMAEYYGTFCGRWHHNEFWAEVKEQLPRMTDEQCEAKVREIEETADRLLDEWRMRT